MTAGLFLLSRMTPTTITTAASLIMLVLGCGLGLVMQVLVLAVQNAVNYRDLGVATSGAILFRLIGGSLGAAVLGAIFAAQLAPNLARLLPPEAGAPDFGTTINSATLAQLPAAAREAYALAFTQSLSTAFLFACVVAVVGFALTWLLPERPLRETVGAATGSDVGTEVGHAFAMPSDADSLAQLLRGLAVLADRDIQRRYIEVIIKRAGVGLSAGAAWLLIRVEREPATDLAALGRRHRVAPERLRAFVAELAEQGLVIESSSEEQGGARRETTALGCEVLHRIAAARRDRLAEVSAQWQPEEREEIAAALRQLAREIVPDPKSR